MLGRGGNGVTITAPTVIVSIDGRDLAMAAAGVRGVLGVTGRTLLPGSVGRAPPPVYDPAPATAMSLTMPSISRWMSLTRTMPLYVMACSSLGRGDALRSSAAPSTEVRMRMIVGLMRPLPRDRRGLRPRLRPRLDFLPPRWLPPRPNLVVLLLELEFPPREGEVEGELLLRLSQPTGSFWPISGSFAPGAGRLVAMTLRANQPPRSRERKMGRRAGAEAVMSARLVSMAEVTKPTLLEAELGKMETLKRPWMRMTSRTVEVRVTLGHGISYVDL